MQQQNNYQAFCVSPTAKKTYPIYSKAILGISVTVLVLGIICIILQIAGSSIEIGLGAVGAGIWSGVWFIITGSFGICASKSRTKCKIVTFLVMCILSASLFAVALLTISSIGLAEDEDDIYWSDVNAALALNSTLLVLSVVIGVLSIVGSSLSCQAFCCRPKTEATVQISHTMQARVAPHVDVPQAGPSQVVVLVPSQIHPGHYTLAPNQVALDNQRNATAELMAPPHYDNLGYAGYGAYGASTVPAPTVDYPAVHQPTTNTDPQNETKTNLDHNAY